MLRKVRNHMQMRLTHSYQQAMSLSYLSGQLFRFLTGGDLSHETVSKCGGVRMIDRTPPPEICNDG